MISQIILLVYRALSEASDTVYYSADSSFSYLQSGMGLLCWFARLTFLNLSSLSGAVNTADQSSVSSNQFHKSTGSRLLCWKLYDFDEMNLCVY